MRTATVAAQMLVRLLGVVLIILGVLFWAGTARGLIPVHMLLGSILVLALWVLAGLGARAHVGTGLVVFAFLWGILVLAVGMGQMSWLPGSAHWVVQAVHLLLGLAAMGFAEVIGGRIRRGMAAVA